MRPMKRARKAFTNVSGEEIPPYAFVAIVDGADTEKQHILDGDIPDGGDDTIYLVNGPKTIADSATGHGYWTSDVCIAAYDPDGSTPVPGQEWGPVLDSWYLDEQGEGFIILSVASGAGVCRIGKKDRITTGAITSSAGTCSCGTQYSRGSVVLTWSGVDVEFATTYSTGWTDFPEITHIGGGVWESATATLDTCHGGIRSAKVQLTAIEPISMTATDFDGDVITFTAKIEVISVTNSCTGVDDDLANITAKFYCDNFNNLATSTFELVAYHNTGDYQFPCTICVSPTAGTSCAYIDALWQMPSAFEITISGTYNGSPYDKTVVTDTLSTSGGPGCDSLLCQFSKNHILDCGFGSYEQWDVLARDYCGVNETDPLMSADKLYISVFPLSFECQSVVVPFWAKYITGGPERIPSFIDMGNSTSGASPSHNLNCTIQAMYV